MQPKWRAVDQKDNESKARYRRQRNTKLYATYECGPRYITYSFASVLNSESEPRWYYIL